SVPAAELVGVGPGAVGRSVVDHQDVEVGRGSTDAGDDALEVAALVVGRHHEHPGCVGARIQPHARASATAGSEGVRRPRRSSTNAPISAAAPGAVKRKVHTVANRTAGVSPTRGATSLSRTWVVRTGARSTTEPSGATRP